MSIAAIDTSIPKECDFAENGYRQPNYRGYRYRKKECDFALSSVVTVTKNLVKCGYRYQKILDTDTDKRHDAIRIREEHHVTNSQANKDTKYTRTSPEEWVARLSTFSRAKVCGGGYCDPEHPTNQT